MQIFIHIKFDSPRSHNINGKIIFKGSFIL